MDSDLLEFQFINQRQSHLISPRIKRNKYTCGLLAFSEKL